MHIIIHLAKSGFLTVIKTITAIIDEFYNRNETRKNTRFNVVRQKIYIYICVCVCVEGVWVGMRAPLLIF
jgi:hypothetical protein